ncbi:hypothetical protein DFH28DRAFT_455072 [Melampsora americana]|nr:hypothetical protein DFH28DRAFT_455072 [Melampsora americana]
MFTTKLNSINSNSNSNQNQSDPITPHHSKRNAQFFITSDDLKPISKHSNLTEISTPTLTYHSKPLIQFPTSTIMKDDLPNQKLKISKNHHRMDLNHQQLQLPLLQTQLDSAMSCEVLDSVGTSFEFSQLIHRTFPTVVIFIRNFRCAFCQAYIKHLSLIANERQEYEVIKSSGIKVLIIGLGSHSMIGKYRALFPCPYPIYTDPSESNKLYHALGMSKRSIESGPESFKGDYLESMSTFELISYGIKNSLKLPALKSPGDLKQLGGELIFEPVPIQKSSRVPIKFKPFEFHTSNPLLQSDQTLFKTTTVSNPHRNAQVSLSTDRSLIYSGSSTLPFSKSISSHSKSNEKSKSSVKIHCRFVHRMNFTRDHLSLYDLFGKAGIRLESNPKKTLHWI